MTPVKEVSFREAPAKEAILKGKAADLVMLPLLHHYKLNSGKYITTGFMKCVDPDTDILNTGVYRHAGTKIAKTLANGDLPQVILPISIIEYVNDQREKATPGT
jgi:UbiD family decarboxylase